MNLPHNLPDWLTWIKARQVKDYHSRRIREGDEPLVMGGAVSELGITDPLFPIITVTGTKGKGSTVAMLESILLAGGYRVGAYTSPHYIKYNERIRIQGEDVSDEELCKNFKKIAQTRIPLGIFEFFTLAGMMLFRDEKIDVALLEVGSGGINDPVNSWDADVGIITLIGLDEPWLLGYTREKQGWNKSGIFRKGKPAICSEINPPFSIRETTLEIGAIPYQLGKQFHYSSRKGKWAWRENGGRTFKNLPYPGLPGEHQLSNASAVLMALETLQDRLPVGIDAIQSGLEEVSLPAHFQIFPGEPEIILNVTTNAQSSASLSPLLRYRPASGKTIAVLGLYHYNPAGEVGRNLEEVIHSWYLGTLPPEKGLESSQLEKFLREGGISDIHSYDTPLESYEGALARARKEDRIIVMGVPEFLRPIMKKLSSSQKHVDVSAQGGS